MKRGTGHSHAARVRLRVCVAACMAVAAACQPADEPTEAVGGSYEDLETLFEEWREFAAPEYIGGVPDYSIGAMAAQHARLPQWRARLEALNRAEWTVSQQIDWHLVRAEMNGLDFEHRVRRPWARDPAFYASVYDAESDVPAHEGPTIDSWIDLWTYDYPLSPEDAAELAERIEAIPELLSRARDNLTGDGYDLWVAGLRSFRAQARYLEDLASEVAGTSAALDRAIANARAATDEFHDWIEGLADTKTGTSGIGSDNYTWYMHNVHLVPFSWEEQVTLMRRELARAHASLRLEEHRNRDLPVLERIRTEEEYDRQLNEAVTEYMAFLEDGRIQTVQPWMDPAIRARNGAFTPAEPGQIRNFFSEVNYRDPVVMRTHLHHWIELATMREAPHPSSVRRVPLLYNIWDARSEGLATGMEEMMMHAGLFEGKSRSRELVWILLAQRAARALSGLQLHGNVFDMEEAVAHATTWTPRGWLPDADLVRNEQHLYLRQPGYGTSYLTGKVEIEALMGEWALQQGPAFSIQRFFDGFFAAGVIPTVLTRWEMTGEMDPLLASR